MREPLKWTTKTQRLLLARRRDPAPPPRFNQRSAAKALAAVFEKERPRWRAGQRLSKGEAKRLMSAIIASSPEEKLAEVSGQELQLEVEAARAAVLGLNSHVPWLKPIVSQQLVAFWRGVGGLPFAVEALARSWVYLPAFPKAGYKKDRTWTQGSATSLELSDKTPNLRGVGLRNGFVGPWISLRTQVAASSDEEYDAARATADRLRASTGDEVRYALAFAFPSEPGWALADAEGWMAKEASAEYPDYAGYCLLGSLDDLPAVERFISLVGEAAKHNSTLWKLWLRYLFTVVERVGVATAAPLIKLVEATSTAQHKRELAEVVAVIQSERVAGWFADQTEGPLRSVAAEYLRYFPST